MCGDGVVSANGACSWGLGGGDWLVGHRAERKSSRWVISGINHRDVRPAMPITPRSGWRLLLATRRRSALFYRQYSLRSGIVSGSKTFAKYAGLFCLSSAIGVVTIGTGILVHDAFTYSERHIDRVPVNPLALHPERGGPKNLPIAHVLVDDEEDDEAKALTEKPKLVIVGAGWGVCFLFPTLFLPS